jgi:hypothetical protein
MHSCSDPVSVVSFDVLHNSVWLRIFSPIAEPNEYY